MKRLILILSLVALAGLLSTPAQAHHRPWHKAAPTATPSPTATPTVVVSFGDDFSGGDGLVTNEYAYWNPGLTGIKVSPSWEMTSGSLFVKSGEGWTGVPDAASPDVTSSNGSGSAVFRLVTRRSDFGDAAVSFSLLTRSYVATSRTPAVDWDGVHVFLRYQSEYELYYVSVNRRDGTLAIKKKVPGGHSNGGTYYTLATSQGSTQLGVRHSIRTTIRTNADGSVRIEASIDGRALLTATDAGVGGPPITSPGKVGLRGDNADFLFDNFSVTAP